MSAKTELTFGVTLAAIDFIVKLAVIIVILLLINKGENVLDRHSDLMEKYMNSVKETKTLVMNSQDKILDLSKLTDEQYELIKSAVIAMERKEKLWEIKQKNN